VERIELKIRISNTKSKACPNLYKPAKIVPQAVESVAQAPTIEDQRVRDQKARYGYILDTLF
jgi:hypothetical protein